MKQLQIHKYTTSSNRLKFKNAMWQLDNLACFRSNVFVLSSKVSKRNVMFNDTYADIDFIRHDNNPAMEALIIWNLHLIVREKGCEMVHSTDSRMHWN